MQRKEEGENEENQSSQYKNTVDIVSMNEKLGVDEDNQTVAYFESVNTFELDQQNAVARLEFQDNKLQIVKFDFHLDENHQDWFDD